MTELSYIVATRSSTERRQVNVFATLLDDSTCVNERAQKAKQVLIHTQNEWLHRTLRSQPNRSDDHLSGAQRWGSLTSVL